MIARSIVAGIALCAMHSLCAQTVPSWNAPDSRGSSLPKSPGAVNRIAATSNAVASTAGAAPRDRDCKSMVTRPEQSYATPVSRFYTDGTEDHGRILDVVSSTDHHLASNLEDLQVRIEQLRCENQNLKAKLDYLIRVLVP